MSTIEERIARIATTRRGGLDVPHEVQDEEKLGAIVASMEEHGWIGAPVVALGEAAVTGSHRIPAAVEADVEIPRVELRELLNAFGGDWDAHRAENYDDEEEALINLDEVLPGEVIAYLGIDRQ